MADDTWTSRDLPVLKAVVELFEETGRGPRMTDVVQKVGFDEDTVERALRALYTEPYFEKPMGSMQKQFIFVGAPTSAALRIAGQWPTPEGQLDRLIAAFEDVAGDDTRPDEERGRAEKIGLWLTGALSQVAIGALGGAGSNLISG